MAPSKAHVHFDFEGVPMDLNDIGQPPKPVEPEPNLEDQNPSEDQVASDHEDQSDDSTVPSSADAQGSQGSDKGADNPAKDLASTLIEALQQMGRDRTPKPTPKEDDIAKQSVLPPRFQVEKDLQLSEIDFGRFLQFFIRVSDLLKTKAWSPDVEAWILLQFSPGSTVAHRIRDALGARPTPRSDTSPLIFEDLLSFRSWCFATLFCESLPQDVVDYYLSDLRVGTGSQSYLARDCTNLAHLIRAALSYLPDNFHITNTVVVSRVKGKLPISAKAMLEAHELGRAQTGPITEWEDLLKFLRNCDKSFRTNVVLVVWTTNAREMRMSTKKIIVLNKDLDKAPRSLD